MPYGGLYKTAILYNNLYVSILKAFVYGLVTPTHVYGVSGSPQAFFCLGWLTCLFPRRSVLVKKAQCTLIFDNIWETFGGVGDHCQVLEVPEGTCTGKIFLGAGDHFQVLKVSKGTCTGKIF